MSSSGGQSLSRLPLSRPYPAGSVHFGLGRGAPADPRADASDHAEITTEDGKKIAFFADGVLTPKSGSPIAQLRLNITLTTSAAAYSWVNPIQVWALGTVDFAKGEVRYKAYAV